jgi:hypothetical protein
MSSEVASEIHSDKVFVLLSNVMQQEVAHLSEQRLLRQVAMASADDTFVCGVTQ